MNPQPATVPQDSAPERVVRVEPASDIYETNAAFTIIAELPGVDEQAVEVNIDRNRLIVRAEVAAPPPSDLRLVHEEYSSRKRYERAFLLPENIDRAAVKAALKHGVLTLTLPKSEPAGVRRIAVQAS